MNLALAMIVKNTPEEFALAQKAIASVEKYVSRIYITLNGPDETINLPPNEGKYVYSYFQWKDDFAAARNFNFSQVKEQWILWLDADDTLLKPENLKQVLQSAEDNGVKAIFLKYLYDKDAKGNVTMWHWKCRLIRNDKHGEWKGRIHEDFLQLRKVKWSKDETVIVDHHTTNERGAKSVERNLKILMDQYEKEGEDKDPRTLYYIGTAFLQLNRLEDAEDAFLKYLELSGWPEERYEAYQKLGDIVNSQGNRKKAQEYYMAGATESPQWPDSYFNMAKVAQLEEDWDKCIEWSLIGFTKKRPDSMTMNFPQLLTIIPGSIYAYALLQKGKLDEALTTINQLTSLAPKDQYLQDMRNIIFEAWWNREASKWIVKLANELKENKQEYRIPALLQAIPERLQSHPITTFLKGQFLPTHKWGEKSIVFFCGLTAEPWDPRSLNTGGIGGSETAIIHLAKRLQAKGWEVTIFNWCHTGEGVYDGVTYKNIWDFSLADQYNKLVIWRDVQYAEYDLKAEQLYLDLHDVPDVNEFTENRWKKFDKIFVKSKYHRSLLPALPDEKFAIIPNGIDVERFTQEEKIPHSVIYSSSPNRGLDTLLKMWPKVREQYPDATMRIFYGWNTFFALQKTNPSSIAWMDKIKKQMESLEGQGVINMGRVDQKELASWQAKSTVWAYPTMFPEISCITAMEAQAAGTIPVVADYAALSETVQYGVKIPAPISRPTNKAAFLEALLSELGKDHDTKEMQEWSKKTYTWETITDQWLQRLAS